MASIFILHSLDNAVHDILENQFEQGRFNLSEEVIARDNLIYLEILQSFADLEN